MKTVFSFYWYVILLLFAGQLSRAQVISTLAGNGTGGYSGNGGPASAALLSDALGVCADASGNIFIADHANHVVRVVDTFNVIRLFAGDGTQGYAGDGGHVIHSRLDYPYGIYADRSGNIYISDRMRNVIRKADPNGTITTIAGTGVSGYSGDGGPATEARLAAPMGITGDEEGNVYVVEFFNLAVRKIDKNGIISTFAGNGTAGYSGDGGPADQAQLNSPVGICADKTGNIYIADTDNLVVRKINKSGIIQTVAGNNTRGYSGDGGQATAAQLSSPYGVFVDSTGTLYIGDTRNHVIRKVDADGIITTFAGTGEIGYSGDGDIPAKATFTAPGSICMDAKGNMYIADPESHVIRKIGPCKETEIIFQPEPVNSCTNDNAVFYTEAADDNVTYLWKVNTGNGWSDITDGISYSGSTTGALTVKNISAAMNGHQYQCTVFSSCGQAISQAATLTVIQPNASSTLQIQSPDSETCEGKPIHFNAVIADPVGTVTYSWYLNNIPVGENAPDYISAALKNNDRVQCIVTTDASCVLNPLTTSNEIIVKINPSVTAGIVIQTANTQVCANTAVEFTASGSNEGTNPVYTWKLNGIETGEQSPVYTTTGLRHDDAITCTLISNITCADTATSDAIYMIVYPVPVVSFNPAEIIIQQGTTTLLQPEITGNISRYTWSPARGLSNESILNPLAAPEQSTEYLLKVVSGDGCRDSATVFVKIYRPLLMPSAFTPNGDGKNEVFRIAPHISIELKQFSIYNRWGKKVFETSRREEGWDGKGYSEGVYIWYIIHKDWLSNATITEKGSFLLIK